jgi:hypothetical protein
MSDFPFDIPTTQPSSGGGGSLPYVTVQNEAIETLTNPSLTGLVIPDFTLKITPTSATQKIRLSGIVNGEWSAMSRGGFIFMKRDGAICGPPEVGIRFRSMGVFLTMFEHNYSYTPDVCPFSYIDDPQTTSEVTYTVFLTNRQDPNADFFLNRTVSDVNNEYNARMATTFSAQCFEP